MASSSIKKAFLLLYFVLTICLPFPPMVTDAKPDIINKICSKTMMPCFCLKELRSDARSKVGNYTSLAGILLDKIEPRVNTMKDMIDSFLKRGDLPFKQQLRLSRCLDYCNEAIADISWCRHAINMGDFKELKSQSSSGSAINYLRSPRLNLWKLKKQVERFKNFVVLFWLLAN